MYKKTVFLRRKEAMGHLPKEILAGAKVKLGSIYVNRLPLKGAEGEEEGRLLKKLVNTPYGHSDFSEKANEFWASLSVRVPFEGKELDLSTYDGDAENPGVDHVNPMDYVIYRWALKHRQVAADENAMRESSDKKFYIFDPQKDLLSKNAQVQLRKQADAEFLKLDNEKKTLIFRALGYGDPSRYQEMDIENTLYNAKNEKPKLFLETCQDTSLEVRAEIEDMLDKGILIRTGNTILFQEEIVGEDMKEAIVYFKSKKNSGQLTTMRARLKEVEN